MPPGTSTRATSCHVGTGSIQCHEDDATTASAPASGNGIDSPRPATARTSGTEPSITARMRSSGSTATTVSARSRSNRASLPVPAPRSTAVRTGTGRIHSTAAAGGPGR